MIKNCLICVREFKTFNCYIKTGRGKFCSSVCYGKSKIGIDPVNKRPKIKHICRICNNEFYLNVTRNKREAGKYCSYACYWENLKGKRLSKKTEFKTGDTEGVRAWNWKGNGVGYYALHSWVNRKLGRASICQWCGSKNHVQWANKSHEYKRDLTDWLELCYQCHRSYDKKNGWGMATKKYNL